MPVKLVELPGDAVAKGTKFFEVDSLLRSSRFSMDGRTGGRNGTKQLLSQSPRRDLARIDSNFHQGRSLSPVVHARRDGHHFPKILAILNPIQVDAQVCELAVVEMAIL